MEEDDENYLAILSDSADHCVTRKVCGHYGDMLIYCTSTNQPSPHWSIGMLPPIVMFIPVTLQLNNMDSKCLSQQTL